jgi:hypothetical protein
MCCLSFSKLAVAASRCSMSVAILLTVSLQVDTPTPQAARRLFAVGQDVAKFLVVVALRKSVSGFIQLYLDRSVVDIGKFKHILGHCRP